MQQRSTHLVTCLTILAALLFAPCALSEDGPPNGWAQHGNTPGQPPQQPGQDEPWAQDAAPDWVVPGARITLYGQVANTLKKNDPQNPRIGTAGTGYQQYDIIAVTPAGVLMEYRNYVIPLNETRPQLSDVQLMLVDAASGGQLWVPRSELQNIPVTTDPDANPKIELAPYTIDGDTYDAIHFTRTQQNNGTHTTRRVYDQRTGLVLYQSETLDNDEGTAINNSEFRSYRVAQLPWHGTQYTDRVRGLDKLVYDFTSTNVTPGLPPQSIGRAVTFDLGQSTESIMQVAVSMQRHAQRGAPPMDDAASQPVEQMLCTNQRLGLYIAPDVLTQLEDGQDLDVDPDIGYRIVVTDVYQVDGVTLVEITEHGPQNSYVSTNTYDASVGLLVHAEQTIPGLDMVHESVLIAVE
ncbi:hypothetical protein OT109_12960 [Phycisphaeraceae bacterium D3-23]